MAFGFLLEELIDEGHKVFEDCVHYPDDDSEDEGCDEDDDSALDEFLFGWPANFVD